MNRFLVVVVCGVVAVVYFLHGGGHNYQGGEIYQPNFLCNRDFLL